jgi:hypothetical protein
MAFRKKNKTRENAPPKLTIDSLHKNMTAVFAEKQGTQVQLTQQRTVLAKKIAELKKQPGFQALIPDVRLQAQVWDLESQITALDKELAAIKTKTYERDYLIKTGKILNKYYKLLNKEKEITEEISKIDFQKKHAGGIGCKMQYSSQSQIISCNSKPNTTNTTNTINTTNTNTTNTTIKPMSGLVSKEKQNDKSAPHGTASIIDMLNSSLSVNYTTNIAADSGVMKDSKQKLSSTIIRAKRGKKRDIVDWLDSSEPDESEVDKEKLYDQYMRIVDPSYVSQIEDEMELFDICSHCHGEMLLNHNSGMLNCKNCGLTEKIIVDSDKQSHKEPPKEMTSFSYKRINHLNEILSQFQAKETTEIPQAVYEKIEAELKKGRITDMTLLTKEKLREILKKIDETDYYEHIPYIINQLNGLPPPVISAEVEEIIRGLFLQAQPPFNKYCPDDRKNFLTYGYTLYKLFELLELDDYLCNFKFLKDRKKLYDQEQIWKKICNELKWEFIPSVI